MVHCPTAEVTLQTLCGKCQSTWTADDGRNVPRINTSLVEILSADLSEPPSSQVKLEISKTEKYRNNNILAEEAAQIFDDKIPVQQKLKLLNRIATVKDDGTVEFEVPGDVEPHTFGVGSGTVYNGADDEPLELTDPQYIPPLQIVILIVGTRGDVQTFIAIGKRLQDYGHHVRLATHSNFKDFVLTAGLEFYPLGGDPKILAGWHTHVAEALKVPLHVFFMMPWTPTSEFPYMLSRVKQSAGYRLSYQIVDSLIWLGIRDMVNDLRMKKLKLRLVTYFSGSQGSESDVPYGYIWSPHLVPKP
ncbi:Sterol 3-beta-glucosyltransferase UGT80A2 [Camellia lanceoleosa]|uniref:Sterol 3-beta-glucosyltransferase UGT80A2 n=1 Tax=Camellia lanceoleosa TaxID=1840588 RepID=A0ACC0F3A4_9ERIC|nr:Sterol 3-beta-glucosyltransferase UGT80A2 [Camellia lanceoleosa]